MSQRRKSQSPTAKNKDSVPCTPVFSFYQESGQSYRPFTDPKRIETNDAKKSCGMDPRVHVKGVPSKFLGVMDPVGTSPPSVESALTIENQPPSEQPQVVFDSDCQQDTINPNVDSSLFTSDGTLNLPPAPSLHLDIPFNTSAYDYTDSSSGTFNVISFDTFMCNDRLEHISTASLDSSDLANTLQRDLTILEGIYTMESELSPLYSPVTPSSDSSNLSFDSFNNPTMPEMVEDYHHLEENYVSRTSLSLPHSPSYVSSFGPEVNLEMSNYPDGFLSPDMNIDLSCADFLPKSSGAGFPSYESYDDRMPQFQPDFDSGLDYQEIFSQGEDPVLYSGQAIRC